MYVRKYVPIYNHNEVSSLGQAVMRCLAFELIINTVLVVGFVLQVLIKDLSLQSWEILGFCWDPHRCNSESDPWELSSIPDGNIWDT